MFTRFHDAVVLASKDQKARSDARRAIIVLTDGIDNGGGTTFQAAVRGALQSQTTVYVISNTEIERAEKERDLAALLAGSDSSIKFNQLRIQDLRLGLDALAASEKNLQDLTSATGGRLYKPKSFQDLEAIYSEWRTNFNTSTPLLFSSNKRRDGQFRRVRVEATNPKFPRFRSRWLLRSRPLRLRWPKCYIDGPVAGFASLGHSFASVLFSSNPCSRLANCRNN
jgi:hypothetical protein